MFDLILKIFLFLSPIIFLFFQQFPLLNGKIAGLQFYQFGFFTTNTEVIQQQFFQYGVVILFIVALFSKQARVIKDKSLGLLLIVCILGVIWHTKTIKSFYSIFLGFLLFYLVATYTKNIKPVLKIIVVVSILNTLFAVLQFFNINLIYSPKYTVNTSFGGSEIFGLMSYKTQLGIYQALSIPICYLFNPFLSIIPLIGLLLSKSLTAVICALIGSFYLLREKISRIRFSYIYFMVFISLIVVYSIRLFLNFNHKLDLRLDVWSYSLKMFFKNWFYGAGLGLFKYQGALTTYQNPYSFYLQVANGLGILGFLALLFFIKDKLVGINKENITAKVLFCSCLILVLSGLGYCLLDYPRLAGTTIVLFGLLTIIKKEVRNED